MLRAHSGFRGTHLCYRATKPGVTEDHIAGALHKVWCEEGAIAEAVDKAGRDVIRKQGFGKHHKHRLGYSIGVNYPPDWGEGQIISIRKGETRALEENMTFHLVPGCLIFDEMGVVTSASVRVTATGCEVLNTIPAKLFEN